MLHFKRILYSQIVPVELEGVIKFSAVVFLVGEGCLLSMPCAESMRLVTVHCSDRFDGFFFGDRGIFKGIPVSSRAQENRGTGGNLLHAQSPLVEYFILASRYKNLGGNDICFAYAIAFFNDRRRFFKRHLHFPGLFTGNGGFLFNRPQFDFGGRREFALHRRVAFILPCLNGFPVHRHIERGSVVADGGVGIIRVRQGHLVIASFQVPDTSCQIQFAVRRCPILLAKFLVSNGDDAFVVGFHAEIIQAVFLDLDEHFRRSGASGVLARRTVKVERHRVNSEFLRNESLLPVADKLRADRLVQWYIIIHVPDRFLFEN